MKVQEYMQLDAYELAALIKKKDISPMDALACAEERLEEVNPLLNAIVTTCFDEGKKYLSQMTGDEPYYGVPLLIKDLSYMLTGVPTTEGSKFFSQNVPKVSSDFVVDLIRLGFVPIAKTTTPELGLSYVTEAKLFGPTRNPLDPTRTPGGSSGGSAAAVAAGIAPVAMSSDGGGSIRIPAACCGLFGFKPTHGFIPSGPMVSESWSGMATGYVLTRSIRDSADIFNRIVTSRLPLKPAKKGPLKISLLQGAFADVPVDAACQEALQIGQQLLTNAGHQLQTTELLLDIQAIGECTLTLIAANTCAVIEKQKAFLGREPKDDELEAVTWEFYEQGKRLSSTNLIWAKDRLYQLTRPLHQLLQQVDVVLTPALAKLPLSIGALDMNDEFHAYLQKNVEFTPFMSLFNQTGTPAMTIPVMKNGHLSVSIQLAAAKGSDLTLFNLAETL